MKHAQIPTLSTTARIGQGRQERTIGERSQGQSHRREITRNSGGQSEGRDEGDGEQSRVKGTMQWLPVKGISGEFGVSREPGEPSYASETES